MNIGEDDPNLELFTQFEAATNSTYTYNIHIIYI
jgi:hypothetical protein